MTYLTVPISAGNVEQATKQIDNAKNSGGEAIELRTDYLQNLNPAMSAKLLDYAKSEACLPVIVTCRDKQQGGCLDYAEDLRIKILTEAVRTGADFVDCEYDNYIKPQNRRKIETAFAKHPKVRLILSAHNFEGKFDDIKKLYGDILTQEAEAIPKLVYKANHINDCFESFDLLHEPENDSIILCMGEAGIVSRIIVKKLGGLVTYASLNEKSATAPGQITIEEFKNLYLYDSINEKTELYGIIGSPVAHSLSPLIHNRCFEQIGANKLYLPLPVDGGKNEFDEFLDNILSREWLDFRGFSVTIPHKQNALTYVRQKGGFIEPLAEKIGAANTIIVKRGACSVERRVKAYNTDYLGALDAITAGMNIGRADLKGYRVAVLGAGGVARAIVAGLSDIGAKVKIYNRTVEKAERLAIEFGCEWAGLDELENIDAKLVINCTSIGMYPDIDATPLPKAYIKNDMIVFDTVYNPRQSRLLKEAKETGAKTIDGLSMFINQAATQFELFTGKFVESSIIKSKINNINY